MIEGEYWKLLDDPAAQQIDAAAVRLLEKTGARIGHQGLLRLLEGCGCRVDWTENRCRFPEPVIRKAIAHVGGRIGTQLQRKPGWNPHWRMTHSGSQPHLLHWPSGQRRLATRQDVIDMARMAHVLDEFDVVGRVLTCAEVDPRIEPLWTTLTLARTTSKRIGQGEIFYADYIPALREMEQVLRGGVSSEGSLIAECDFWIAPLIMDPNQAECFIAKRKLGLINVPGTMPVSGMSAPVTIAGTVAICIAELLAGWVVGWAINPDVKVGGIVASASLDMRTMTALFCSPEAALQNTATVNVCRRLYGTQVWAASSYIDAKRPGLEAAYQKMYGLVGAPFGAPMLPGTDGLLSAGQDYSPVQHLLDIEIASAVDRFWGHFQVSPETLATELTEQIMLRPDTNFLDTDHTIAHWKQEQWYPRWLDRTAWQGAAVEVEAEHRMLQRISDYCRDAVARYEPPELDRAKIAELERIFRAAERQILGGARTELAETC